MKCLQKILEMASWFVLLICFGIAIYGMKVLPPSIATHFNAMGQADGYGSPASLLVTPIIFILSNGLMSLIAHKVGLDAVNLPYQVREEKRKSVFEVTLTMLFAVELEISFLALWVQIRSFQQNGDHYLFPVVFFFVILTATIFLGFIIGYKENKKK